MKIRTGYISNSSSTSFIIRENSEFPTVKSVAEHIIHYIMEKWGTDTTNFDKEFELLSKMKNPDTPVYFGTSDGTYIRKTDGLIVVSTFQGLDKTPFSEYIVPFDDLSQDFLSKYMISVDDEDGNPTSEKELMTCQEDFDYFYNEFEDFLILPHGFYGREEYMWNVCPKCGEKTLDAWRVKGQIYCSCQTDHLIQLSLRGEKLKKINKVK